MAKGDTSVATKKDLQLLEHRLRLEIQNSRAASTKDIQDLEQRLRLYFEFTAENLTENFRGIFSDRLAQHEDRLHRLEQHARFNRGI